MMIYEVTVAETLVKYVVYHNVDAELIFRVAIDLIGTSVRLSVIREEHLNSIYTIFRVFYETTIDVHVTLTWV